MDLASNHYAFSANLTAKFLNLSPQAALKICTRFQKAGFLNEITGKKPISCGRNALFFKDINRCTFITHEGETHAMTIVEALTLRKSKSTTQQVKQPPEPCWRENNEN